MGNPLDKDIQGPQLPLDMSDALDPDCCLTLLGSPTQKDRMTEIAESIKTLQRKKLLAAITVVTYLTRHTNDLYGSEQMLKKCLMCIQ